MEAEPRSTKIFVFVETFGCFGGTAYALTESGTLVGHITVSNDKFTKPDMLERYREEWNKKYPNGYTVEHVPYGDKEWSVGLVMAQKLNRGIA